jgi:hypothetical protein
MPWATPNGSRFQAMTHRMWIRVARPNISVEQSQSTDHELRNDIGI